MKVNKITMKNNNNNNNDNLCSVHMAGSRGGVSDFKSSCDTLTMMRSLSGSWQGEHHHHAPHHRHQHPQPHHHHHYRRFDGNLPVNAQDLQNYGLALIKKEDPSFKASSGWALR